MGKLKKGRVKVTICDTCHGNGYVRDAKIDGDPSVDFRDRSEVHQCWTAIRKENFMRQLTIILLMTVLLTSCTKLEFDGFDPTTSMVRWVFTHERH